MTEDAARDIVSTILSALDSLCYSTNLVKKSASQADFENYRLEIARVVSHIADFALEPVFSLHPELRQEFGLA